MQNINRQACILRYLMGTNGVLVNDSYTVAGNNDTLATVTYMEDYWRCLAFFCLMAHNFPLHINLLPTYMTLIVKLAKSDCYYPQFINYLFPYAYPCIEHCITSNVTKKVLKIVRIQSWNVAHGAYQCEQELQI